MTLPLAVLGSSDSVPSSSMNHTHVGVFLNTGIYEHSNQAPGGEYEKEADLRVHACRNSTPHFIAINACMRFAYDPRADDFAVFRIWDRNYGDFSYGRMLGQGVLDLYREKILVGNFD